LNQQREALSDKPYKQAFVDFIKSRKWHWFITIPIGLCDNDDNVLKRLRLIEAAFCGKYLPNRFHKLPDHARFRTVVSFEGESKYGNRHAHILAYIPIPRKNCIFQSTLIERFPSEFRALWKKVGLLLASDLEEASVENSLDDITFGRANTVRAIYTVKDVRQEEVPWSRFEFVTPPKFKTFKNKNRNMIIYRNRQQRAFYTKMQQLRVRLGFDNHVV
jgi:hypothetical protein